MLAFGGGARTYFAAGVTDIRKSFNSLSGIVRERLQKDPMSRHLLLFTNRARNRLKVLVANESGLWVLSKRLDRGTLAWPSATDDVKRIEYREQQLALLLRGFDAQELQPRRCRRRLQQTS